MLNQIEREPRRKLLETCSFHFVIFFDEEDRPIGFELADENEAHVLKWKRGDRAKYFGVRNSGKGYGNHDRIYVNGAFRPEAVLAELEQKGKNIRPEVMAVLREGIEAYVLPDYLKATERSQS